MQRIVAAHSRIEARHPGFLADWDDAPSRDVSALCRDLRRCPGETSEQTYLCSALEKSANGGRREGGQRYRGNQHHESRGLERLTELSTQRCEREAAADVFRSARKIVEALPGSSGQRRTGIAWERGSADVADSDRERQRGCRGRVGAQYVRAE